jgi:hypothetical protein
MNVSTASEVDRRYAAWPTYKEEIREAIASRDMTIATAAAAMGLNPDSLRAWLVPSNTRPPGVEILNAMLRWCRAKRGWRTAR